MAICWFITYEYKGKKGNSFSQIKPFDWLVKYRKTLGNDLVLVQHTLEDHPMGFLPAFEAMINIEDDYPEIFKVPEVVQEVVQEDETPNPDVEDVSINTEEVVEELEQNVSHETVEEIELPEPVDPKEELKKKRAENLKKAREAKKKKAE